MNNLKIIDIHAHIFPEKVASKAIEGIGQFYGAPMSGNGTVEELLESGSKVGIYKYVVHSTATREGQVQSINNFIAQAQASNPSLIGFGTLHPDMQDIDSEVDRIISLGLKGIKLHPDFQGFNLDDDKVLPIYNAVQGRLPIITHMGDAQRTNSHPSRLVKILDMYPHLTVIAAHLGGYMMWNESLEYLVGRNIYFDTSSSLFKLPKETAVRIMRKHGVEKVLFGSDYPMWLHEEELERFNKLGLTEEERRLILSENACKLLAME